MTTLSGEKITLREYLTSDSEEIYRWRVDEKTTRYIGGIDLTSIDWIAGNAVLSLVVGAEADRNHGYGSEAVDLLLGYAFHHMGLHRVSLNVCEQNEAAVRCYIGSGFQVEGRRRDEVFLNGTYYDLIQMGILQTEYHS